MIKRDKELIVVGDRVLVRVEEGEERTNVGLYLPPTAIDNQAVQGGTILATGPGLPMPSPDSLSDEPWRAPRARSTKFVPMQAQKGRLRAVFPQGGGRDHVRGRSVPRRAAGGDSCARARRVTTMSPYRNSSSRNSSNRCAFHSRCTTNGSSPRCARISPGSASRSCARRKKSTSTLQERQGHDARRRELGVRMLGAHGAAGGRDRAAESDQAGSRRRRCSRARTPKRRSARAATSPAIRRHRRRSACSRTESSCSCSSAGRSRAARPTRSRTIW